MDEKRKDEKRMNKIDIRIPLYGAKVRLINCKKLADLEKKYNLTSTIGFDAITFKPIKKRVDYVVAFEGNTSVATIAHEALHVVGLLFDDYSIKMDIENDEPQCYLLGWLVGKIVNFLEK